MSLWGRTRERLNGRLRSRYCHVRLNATGFNQHRLRPTPGPLLCRFFTNLLFWGSFKAGTVSYRFLSKSVKNTLPRAQEESKKHLVAQQIFKQGQKNGCEEGRTDGRYNCRAVLNPVITSSLKFWFREQQRVFCQTSY